MQRITLFACLTMSAVACSKPATTTTTTGGTTTTADARERRQHSAASFDRDFIDMMVPHHEQAMTMADMARERAQHEELKAMAEKSRGEQAREIATLKSWRKQWFGSEATPPKENMAMLQGMRHDARMEPQAMRAELESASDFDRAFLEVMIRHHESGVEAAQKAVEQAAHPELRALGREIATKQRAEIEEMRMHLAHWYGAR